MRFELDHGPGVVDLTRFLERNGFAGSTVRQDGAHTTIDVPPALLTDGGISTALSRHFAFMDLFQWVENGLEDVAFWDKAQRWPAVIAEVERFFPSSEYDVIATVESRGFFVAGVLSHALGKPVIPVRKYREAFAGHPGHMITYLNWRGRRDRLWLQRADWLDSFAGSRALFVDDLIETGNSLFASRSLLNAAGINVAGAFYLMDASQPHVRERFDFSIRSLLRLHSLETNLAPALGPGATA